MKNISLQDFFKNSFYISVDMERMRAFRNIFSKMFFFDENIKFPNMFWGYVNSDLKPTYRCELSHASLIKLAKSMELPFVVIFEDDAYPCAFSENKIEELLNNTPDNAKMLILGYNKFKDSEKVNDYVSILKSWCWGSHSYMIFKDGYDDYLREYNKNSNHVADDFFGILKNVYISNENLFIQRCSEKSMNGYSGYVYNNESQKNPPKNFFPLSEITRGVDSKRRLIQEIKGIGEFLYRANGGNAGDFLISSSEFQMFADLKLKYTTVSSKNKRELLSKDFNLVYGGGGGWVKYYKNSYQNPLNEFFKSKRLKKCVVMPSSFYCCDDVVDSFDERFTVFCRDLESYKYCTSRNKKAKFYVHDDMALQIDISRFDYNIDLSSMNTNFERIRNAISSSKKYVSGNNTKEASLIRTDVEKTINSTESNFDLSNIFGAYGEDITKKESDEITSVILNVINRYDTIKTNRLHMMIASHLLGKKIDAYDNSYGKIRNVYNYSLKNDLNITFHENK